MARREQGRGGVSEFPVPGGEERSDEAAGAGAPSAGAAPDPEVVAKPTRRQFTAGYRLRILEEADRCTDPNLPAMADPYTGKPVQRDMFTG